MREGEGERERGEGGREKGREGRDGEREARDWYTTYMHAVRHSLGRCIQGYHAYMDQACIAGTELVADVIRLSHPPFLPLPAQ